MSAGRCGSATASEIDAAVAAGVVTLDGDATALTEYASLLDDFDRDFPIGVPERAKEHQLASHQKAVRP